MARSRLVALAALCLVSLGASCDRGPKAQSAASAADVAPPSGERIEHLDGVDTAEMTDAETTMWVGLINDELSPCGDPMSVARWSWGRRDGLAYCSRVMVLSAIVISP